MATEQIVIGSERLLRELKRQVDGALFRLRAWQTFRDAETHRWTLEVRESLASGGPRPGLAGDDLQKALDERRRQLPH